jgi:hypothetical protein
MIVILKRDDLRETYRQWSVEDLLLEHAELAPELVEQAELIVFVEGSHVKFLKHLSEMISPNRFDILISYIKSKPPTMHMPFTVKGFPKHFRHRKEGK